VVKQGPASSCASPTPTDRTRNRSGPTSEHSPRGRRTARACLRVVPEQEADPVVQNLSASKQPARCELRARQRSRLVADASSWRVLTGRHLADLADERGRRNYAPQPIRAHRHGTFSTPDGQSIYFTSDRGGSPQSYRMAAAGASRRESPSTATTRLARVSPDARLSRTSRGSAGASSSWPGPREPPDTGLTDGNATIPTSRRTADHPLTRPTSTTRRALRGRATDASATLGIGAADIRALVGP